MLALLFLALPVATSALVPDAVMRCPRPRPGATTAKRRPHHHPLPAASPGHIVTWPFLRSSFPCPRQRVGHILAQQGGDELLKPDGWVESGVAALNRLPAICKRLSQQNAEAEHLAIAFLEQGGERGLASRILSTVGASPQAVKTAFEAYAKTQPTVSGGGASGPDGKVNAGSSLMDLLTAAAAQKSLLSDDFLSAEHVLLALLNNKRCGRRILTDAVPGLSQQTLRAAMDQVRGNKRVTSRTQDAAYESLDKYARDLTAIAREGKLDPVIGRDDEVRRATTVLSRRTKNNPIVRPLALAPRPPDLHALLPAPLACLSPLLGSGVDAPPMDRSSRV